MSAMHCMCCDRLMHTRMQVWWMALNAKCIDAKQLKLVNQLTDDLHQMVPEVLPYRRIVISPSPEREGGRCSWQLAKWHSLHHLVHTRLIYGSLALSSASTVEKKHIEVGHIGTHTNHRDNEELQMATRILLAETAERVWADTSEADDYPARLKTQVIDHKNAWKLLQDWAGNVNQLKTRMQRKAGGGRTNAGLCLSWVELRPLGRPNQNLRDGTSEFIRWCQHMKNFITFLTRYVIRTYPGDWQQLTEADASDEKVRQKVLSSHVRVWNTHHLSTACINHQHLALFTTLKITSRSTGDHTLTGCAELGF